MNWWDFIYGMIAGIVFMCGASAFAVAFSTRNEKAARTVVHMFMNMKK